MEAKQKGLINSFADETNQAENSDEKSFFTLSGCRGNIPILLAIIVIGFAFRLYCFYGFWGTDDALYASLANAMAEGTYGEFVKENYIDNFNGPAHVPYRLGLMYPLSIMFKLFGISETSLVIYPLFISFLAILLAYYCGRLLFGGTAGLIAAAIWACLPVDILNATQYLPDTIVSFYASMGIVVILSLINFNVKRYYYLFFGGFCAGLLFVCSWFTKESVVYFVPFCTILLIVSVKKDWKMALLLWGGVAVSSLGILFAEMIFYLNMSGDFLLRLHESERSFMQTKSYLFYEGSRFGWPEGGNHLKAVLERLFVIGPQRIFFNSNLLFLPLFGLIASVYAFFRKDKVFLIPFLWMISLALMYNFWSISFSSYSPLTLSHRYIHPIILPATLLASGLIVRVFFTKVKSENTELSRKRFLMGFICSVFIILCCFIMFRTLRDMKQKKPIFETRTVYSLVKPSDQLYTDPLSIKAAEFFWGYPKKNNLNNFEGMSDADIPANSFVLLDRVRVNWLKVNVGMWLTHDYGYNEPDFFDHPSKSWKIVWQNDIAKLYRVTF